MLVQMKISIIFKVIYGLLCGSNGKESTCNAGDKSLILGLGRSPVEGSGNLHQYSCLGKSHGQRSLAGYSSWGHKEWDMTEQLTHTLHTHTHTHTHIYITFPWSIHSLILHVFFNCLVQQSSLPPATHPWWKPQFLQLMQSLTVAYV